MKDEYFVLNTNALISAFLLPESISRKALNHATQLGRLAISDSVLQEFSEVLFRKKFDKYFLNDEERLDAINRISSYAVLFSPTEIITACRDPKDNKFLELAVTANASCIITGDKDLLELNPFREIPVLSAADFLNKF